MTKFNAHSILFACIVLVLVMMGERGSHEASRAGSVSAVARTSLAEARAPFVLNTESVAPSPSLIGISSQNTSAVGGFISNDVSGFFDLQLSAKRVLVQELDTPSPLYAVGAREPWPLASITKLLTALTARDLHDNGALITITKEAVDAPGISGFLKEGEVFTVRDLIQTALGVSSNDAAEALAGPFDREEFVKSMQDKIYEVGMTQTSVFDPTGLSPLNFSTAEDLEKLATHILARAPDFFLITRSPVITIREEISAAERVLQNNNAFAGKPWFIGGKTGYTDESKGNLLSVVMHGNRTFIIVVLGSDDRFRETEKIIEQIRLLYY